MYFTNRVYSPPLKRFLIENTEEPAQPVYRQQQLVVGDGRVKGLKARTSQGEGTCAQQKLA